jgi:hypothetical protein
LAGVYIAHPPSSDSDLLNPKNYIKYHHKSINPTKVHQNTSKMVRYYNRPSIFSRSRRHHPHHQQPHAHFAADPTYRDPAVLSRSRRRGFGGRRNVAAAPVAVEPEPVLGSGALPVQRRRRLGGGLGRRSRAPRAGVVEQPAVQQRRRTSIGDKIAGALMKLQGTITRRPGLKVGRLRHRRFGGWSANVRIGGWNSADARD